MKTIKMMPFEKEEVNEILEIVGARSDENNNIIYEDKIVLCEGCGTSIKKENLGSVIPNTEHFICDNPICFYKYYNKVEAKREV